MSYFIANGILAASVANNGTLSVSYPSATNAGTYAGGVGHSILIGGSRFVAPVDFSVTFGASNITITNLTGVAWTAGEKYYLELQTVGNFDQIAGIKRSVYARLAYVNIGAPVASDADGIAASQEVAANANALLDGALKSASSLAITLDVPRNVVAAWTGTAVVTVNGLDEYDNPMSESSASGTSFTGKKAFKVIKSVSFSAAVTAATVGTGKVLGLPAYLSDATLVIKEIQNASTPASAGTFVSGDTAKPTATTGDVRGTYAPNADPDGSKSFRLVLVSADPSYRGSPQFAG